MSHYGNYKPDFFKTDEKAHNLRFKLFWAKIYRNIIPVLKKLCMGIILALAVISCKPKQIIVEKDKLVYVTKDSIVHRDSICYIPIERYVDIVPIYDTLVLENSISISRSWADTTNHLLRGELKNKNAIQHQVKYIERIVTNDSIVDREVPRPYPVIEEKIKRPWWAWICLIWTIISIASIIWTVYIKLKK